MRKFTTIASALMLGCFGFVANAAVTTVTPTATPADGSAVLIELPAPLVTWGTSTLSLNTESNDYHAGSFYSAAGITVQVLVNGEEVQNFGSTVTTNAYVGEYTEEYGDGYWQSVDSGTTLVVEAPQLSLTENATITYVIPADGVLVGSDTNDDLELEYTYVYLPDEPTATPAKGSSQFSVSSVVLTWPGAKLSANKDYDGEVGIQYGGYTTSWEVVPAKDVKSVTYNSDGTATIDLGVDYTTPGTLRVEIPAGYLTISTDEGSTTNKNELVVNYTINTYLLSPQNYGSVWGPLSSVYIYAQKSIDAGLATALQVTVTGEDGMEVEGVTVSRTITTYNNLPAVQITLSQPIEDGSLTLIIPEQWLSADGGTPNAEPIEWQVYARKGATVQPSVDSRLASLSNVMFSYPTEFELAADVEGTPTLTIGDDEPIDISKYVTTAVENTYNEETDQSGSLYSLVVDFGDDAYTTPGEYTITIPAGYVYFSQFGLYNEELTATYTVAPVEYTLNPVDGATVADLMTVSVEFSEKNVEFYENMQTGVAVLEHVATGTLYYCSEPTRNTKAMSDGIVYDFVFIEQGEEEAAPITAPGYYTMTIRGAYLVGEDNEPLLDVPAINATYEIQLPYSITPEDGATVEELSTVSIVFSEAVSQYSNSAVATLENNTTGELYYCQELVADKSYDGTGAAYTLSFTELGDTDPVTFTEVGAYTLTIKGLYLPSTDADGDNVDLPVITTNFNVVPEGFVLFTPESGSTVSDLSTIQVTFAQRVGFVAARPAVGILTNTSTGDVYYCENPLMNRQMTDEGAYVYDLTFMEIGETETAEINTVGNYVLTLMGAYLTEIDENGEEGDPEYLPVFTASWSVVPEGLFTLDPADGSVVEEISTISIVFAGNIAFDDSVRPAVVTLENTTTGNAWYCQNPLMDRQNTSENGRAYILSFSELGSSEAVTINETGNYILSIRGAYAGVTEDEEGNEVPDYLPVLTASYIVYPAGTYVLDPENDAEVDELSSVTLTFPGNPNVGLYDVRPGTLTLENVTTGDLYFSYSPMKQRLEDGSSQFTFEFSELGTEDYVTITENGEYQLTIKGLYQSSIDEDGNETEPQDLPNIYATYYIVNGTSGIQQVLDSDVYNVYGVNGVQLLKNGNASDLNSLAPGLYIINGKKVILRK